MHSTIQKSFILIMLFSIISCSSYVNVVSQPATSEFRIDGDRTEWTGRFSVPEDQKFALAISHSKNYLYLALSSMDPTFQRQISMAGLTIWIDSEGKKGENLGLKYVGNRQKRAPRSNSDIFDPGNEGQRGMRRIDGDIELIVVNDNKRERLGPADLLATAKTDHAGMFIEVQIPLTLLGENYLPGQELSLGLQSKVETPQGMSHAARGGSQGRGGGMEGGMAGGQRGGGMDGQRPQSMSGQRPASMSSTELDLWVKINRPQP